MKFVIIAPHPDDELIGCFTLIRARVVSKVYYIVGDKKRLAKAQKLGKKMEFETKTITLTELFTNKIELEKNEICLIPDIRDKHPLHKRVSILGRRIHPVGYYTVDMNTDYIWELPEKLRKEKKRFLDKFYPDQKSLWKNDWKYFLFEGIVLDLVPYVIRTTSASS